MHPYTFHPGDKVVLMHNGHPTENIGVIRETYDNGCILVDLLDAKPDDFPVYDYADQFVLTS
jgi:hypothetical protein